MHNSFGLYLMLRLRLSLMFTYSLFVSGNANAPTFSEFTFTVEPSDTVALRDHPILLNCSAHHDAVKPEIQWIRDDVFVNFEGDDRR